jgi:anhydro-N-acetylmuramic acid kinase
MILAFFWGMLAPPTFTLSYSINPASEDDAVIRGRGLKADHATPFFKENTMLSIGLMSGTSMDGIDAALIETDGDHHIHELGHASVSYDPQFKIQLKAAEYTVRACQGDMEKAQCSYMEKLHEYKNHLGISENIPTSSLNEVIQESTRLHEVAVSKLLQRINQDAKKIQVIGYHGQTLFHQPAKKLSIIVGNAQYLANQLGVPVINDFRSNDIAAGGQGAPFAPLYHQALAIRDNKIPLAVVNCGGIANISLIRNNNPFDLIAFDTGPGNGLIDNLVKQRTHNQEHMDQDGRYGLKGKVNDSVLKALYDKAILINGCNYFSIQPPKSLDIGDMQLIPELRALSLEDACATLEAFTADAICKSLQWFGNDIPQHWILAGGGWNNPVIRYQLDIRLKEINPNMNIQTADEAGWNSQALEAQIFAYLAVRSLQNKALSYPGTTGVPSAMSGGKIFYPN